MGYSDKPNGIPVEILTACNMASARNHGIQTLQEKRKKYTDTCRDVFYQEKMLNLRKSRTTHSSISGVKGTTHRAEMIREFEARNTTIEDRTTIKNLRKTMQLERTELVQTEGEDWVQHLESSTKFLAEISATKDCVKI